MAITLDATSTNTGAGDTTVSHTTGSLTDGMMSAVVNLEGDSTATIDSVVYDPGGVNEFNLTNTVEVVVGGSFINRTAIFTGLDADLPESTTDDVTANVSIVTSAGVTLTVQTWSDVDQSIPSGAQIDTDSGTSIDTVTVTPTATTDSLGIYGASAGGTTSFAPPSGTTETLDATIGTMTGTSGYEIGLSAGAISWDIVAAASQNRLVGAGVIYSQAGAGPTTVVPIFLDSYRRRWA